MLSKEGTDVFVEGEAMYSFMKGYKPPAEAKPYLFDLSKHKLLGLKDWVGAAKNGQGGARRLAEPVPIGLRMQQIDAGPAVTARPRVCAKSQPRAAGR